MPRESYNVRILRAKSLDSLRTGVAAFNTLDDRGRMTTVLLGFQHAFEMLLKAALEAKRSRSLIDGAGSQSHWKVLSAVAKSATASSCPMKRRAPFGLWTPYAMLNSIGT